MAPLHKRTVKPEYLLSDNEENVIAEIIRQIIEEKNYPLTNELVRKVAIRYFYSIHEPDFQHQFSASHKWTPYISKRKCLTWKPIFL